MTGSAYDPVDYPGHGGGLFFVGVEGTASVYAYALLADGGFTRIATLATTFALVADVQWDADLEGLWVACDEACDGRIAFFQLDDSGAFTAARVFQRPAGMTNIANEGFAVADDAVCAGGVKPTFYADDADTDGFSLRSGTLPCETTGGPGEPTPTPTPTPTPSPSLPAEPTPTPSPSVPGEPTPTPTPTPSLPANGAPGPVADDQLTDGTRGSVDAPDTAAAGDTVTIFVGTEYAGQTVWVWLHSTPISLGARAGTLAPPYERVEEWQPHSLSVCQPATAGCCPYRPAISRVIRRECSR